MSASLCMIELKKELIKEKHDESYDVKRKNTPRYSETGCT